MLFNDEEEEIVIFACRSNLKFMCGKDTFYMDGTFDHCPKYFLQMFTTHVFDNGVYFPVVYCLLKDLQQASADFGFEVSGIWFDLESR